MVDWQRDIAFCPRHPRISLLFSLFYRLASIACSQTQQPTAMNQMVRRVVVRGQACWAGRPRRSGWCALFVSVAVAGYPLCKGPERELLWTPHLVGWLDGCLSSLTSDCLHPHLQRLCSSHPSSSLRLPSSPASLPAFPLACSLSSWCIAHPTSREGSWCLGWELDTRNEWNSESTLSRPPGTCLPLGERKGIKQR